MDNCKYCGSNEQMIENKGTQVGLYCATCGKWQKWLRKDEIRVFEHLRKKAKTISNTMNEYDEQGKQSILDKVIRLKNEYVDTCNMCTHTKCDICKIDEFIAELNGIIS